MCWFLFVVICLFLLRSWKVRKVMILLCFLMRFMKVLILSRVSVYLRKMVLILRC